MLSRAARAQDLPRTFPHQQWVAGPEGQAALRRVLLAFSVHRPEVGYCQGMNYLGAMLLCILQHRQEDAFWMLAALIDDGGTMLSPERQLRVGWWWAAQHK